MCLVILSVIVSFSPVRVRECLSLSVRMYVWRGGGAGLQHIWQHNWAGLVYRFQTKARKSVGFTMSAEDLTAASPGSKDEKKKVGGFF